MYRLLLFVSYNSIVLIVNIAKSSTTILALIVKSSSNTKYLIVLPKEFNIEIVLISRQNKLLLQIRSKISIYCINNNTCLLLKRDFNNKENNKSNIAIERIFIFFLSIYKIN